MNILSSRVLIRQTNELDVAYSVPFGEGELDLTSETYIKYRKEILALAEILELGTGIPSKAFIPYGVFLASTARVADSSSMDVTYSIPYGEGEEDIKGRGEVPLRRDFPSRALLEPAKSEVPSRGYVPNVQYFESAARILEGLDMDIVYRLIQAPILSLDLNPIQDAFTREGRPTLNYGKSVELITGALGEGRLYSYLDFNLEGLDYILDMELKSINLTLRSSSPNSGEIEIYEVDGEWYEDSITWKNQPELKSLITISEVSGEVVEVDLKQLIIDKIQNKEYKFRIALKSNGMVRFGSRESSLPPEIRIRYSDPEWIGYLGELDFLSRAVIRAKGSRDFKSKVSLLEHFFMNSKAKIYDPQHRISEVTISRPFLKGKAKIQFAEDFPSKARIVSTIKYSDLKSRMFQPTDNKVSRANIVFPGESDLRSSMWVRSNRIDESFPASAYLTRRYIKCLAMVALSQSLESRVLIRKTSSSDFKSKLAIIGSQVPSRATIRQAGDIVGRAVIRESIVGDLPAFAYVNRQGMYSKAWLRIHEDFKSGAFIRADIPNDIKSKVWLGSKCGSLGSKALILGRGYKDLLSKADLYRISNLQSMTDILVNSNIISRAIVRQFDVSELYSIAQIIDGYTGNELASKVIIKAFTDYYFHSKAYIKTGARQWRPNHEGELEFEDRKLPRLWVRENFILD